MTRDLTLVPILPTSDFFEFAGIATILSITVHDQHTTPDAEPCADFDAGRRSGDDDVRGLQRTHGTKHAYKNIGTIDAAEP